MTLLDHPINRLSEQCIGAAIEVHRALGPGLLESAYQRCLARELEVRGLRYASQVPVCLDYKGYRVERAYCIDLLVEGALIVEIKSVDSIQPVHQSQMLTYLKLTGMRVGLLMNFNARVMTAGIRRILG